jgi:hypothetical protein
MIEIKGPWAGDGVPCPILGNKDAREREGQAEAGEEVEVGWRIRGCWRREVFVRGMILVLFPVAWLQGVFKLRRIPIGSSV